MQEKFALRKTLKKVAAVGTSLAMVGVTLSGALAAGLGDYSDTFSKSNTVVVFGATGSDSAAVNDVSGGLPGSAAASTGVVSGALDLADFEEGERADFEPGTNLTASSAFGKTCFNDNDDLGLVDWDQNINIDRDKDYDVHEEYCFGTGNNVPRLTTSLDELDEDFGTEPILMIPRRGLNYTVVWEQDVDLNNRIANASSSKQVKLQNWLGKTLKITGTNIAGTQLTALVGTEYSMHSGDTVVHNGCTVKILAVDANEVLVDVNGETKSVDEDKNDRFGDCEVTVDSAVETTDGEGIVVIFVGDESTETFSNGNAYAGEDDNHFLWEWNIDRLGATRPFLSVALAESFESDRTDLEDEIMDLDLLRANRRHLQVGDYLCLPNYHSCMVLEGASEEVDRCTYTIDADSRSENLPGISTAFYGASATYDNAKIVDLNADGCGTDQGFKVDTNGDGTFEQDTDRVILFWDGDLDTDNEASTTKGNAAHGELLIYYENADGNETLTNASANGYGLDAYDANGTAMESTTVNVANGASSGNVSHEDTMFQFDNDDLDNMDFALWDLVNGTNHKATNGSVSANSNTTTMALVSLELDDETSKSNGVAPRLWFELGIAASTGLGIDRLGAVKGEDTAKWFRYSTNASNSNSSIASFDEDVLARSGIIVKDPEGNYNDDKIILDVPSIEDYEYWVRMTKPKSGTVSTTGTVVSSDVSMSDEEAGDVEGLGKNVVVVGGPAVNKVAADLLGVDFPTYGSDLAGFAENLAVLEWKTLTNGKAALLVYGWEQVDTRRAAKLLSDTADFEQRLTDGGLSDATSVVVEGTDMEVTGISLSA